jgi:hypothetical protein
MHRDQRRAARSQRESREPVSETFAQRLFGERADYSVVDDQRDRESTMDLDVLANPIA